MSTDVEQAQGNIPERLLYFVFFLSGMAALLYQLIWQRALFVIYGTNSEAITAIVAAFMLGLGLGSLVGGWVSKRTKRSLVALFAIVEICIGVFGLASLAILDAVGAATAGAGPLVSGLLSFLIIVLPTGLMGSTLPLLVTYLVKQNHSVGETVGELYYINTLGSALVCILAVFAIFEFFGMNGAVILAACMNFVVALATFGSRKIHGW